ncbi:MAG: hypothetical protein GXX79_18715 [Actinomycetales bacterium]|nr:hypothetical protein [Actinomycetales bacterium]
MTRQRREAPSSPLRPVVTALATACLIWWTLAGSPAGRSAASGLPSGADPVRVETGCTVGGGIPAGRLTDCGGQRGGLPGTATERASSPVYRSPGHRSAWTASSGPQGLPHRAWHSPSDAAVGRGAAGASRPGIPRHTVDALRGRAPPTTAHVLVPHP